MHSSRKTLFVVLVGVIVAAVACGSVQAASPSQDYYRSQCGN